MLHENNIISLSLPGAPKPKLRPRFSRQKRGVRTYDPQSEENNTMKWQLKARMAGRDPLSGPLHVMIVFVFKRPKSREKLNETFHMVKPDLDNLIKKIGDVGNDILWYDDKQIVSISSVKIYGEVPKTVITVSKALP